MRKISIEEITGDEILAKDIYGMNEKVLLPEGVLLKKDYIAHLRGLNILYVYIKDRFSEGVKKELLSESELKEHCMEDVKNTLEKFTYNGKIKEESLHSIAKEIIEKIIGNTDVLYCVSGIRNHSDLLYSHSITVCSLSVLIALKMNLSDTLIEDIAMGALLHDIGFNRVAVPLKRNNKSEYTEDELKEIKKHVIYGYNMLEQEAWISEESRNIILMHHEREDGSGYPFHKEKNHISLGSKIVAVVDLFDNLVYGIGRKAVKVYEAIEYIMSLSGTKFDSSIVKYFRESVAAYPNGTRVITNEGKIGIVIRQNMNYPTRPVIRLLKNADNKEIHEWIEQDLIKCLTVFISDTLEE